MSVQTVERSRKNYLNTCAIVRMMAETIDRLRRLITNELGECSDTDIDQRLTELDALDATATSTNRDADLRTLSALGSETRYRIVRLLVAADGTLCVCELQPLLDVSESAISHALSDLMDAGLVTKDRDGKWRYYASTERAERLLAALDATGSETNE